MSDVTSNLVKHAEVELAAIGMGEDAEEMDKTMRDNILEMVTVFSKQGHSGFSAGYAASVLHKLLNYEPLGPLTGEDSEWQDVGEQSGYPLKQNIRCGHVFKEGDKAYDTEGIIFRDPDGTTWINHESRTPVTFPYTPERQYVDRSEEDSKANV